jgi:hypothetical protein
MAIGDVLPVLMLEAIGWILVTASFCLFLLCCGLFALFCKEGGEFGLTDWWDGGAAEILLGLLEGLGAGDALVAIVVVDAGEEGGGSIAYWGKRGIRKKSYAKAVTVCQY